MTSLSLFPSELAALADSTDAQNTPRDLALDLGRFDLDVCSNPRSHILADRSFMLERGEDGLALPWTVVSYGDWSGPETRPAKVWCNGPYSDPLPWCERLSDHDGAWVALWKLDPTTAWFRRLVINRNGPPTHWAPFAKRLAFERAGNVGSADFPSVLVWRRWQPPKAVLARLLTPRSEP